MSTTAPPEVITALLAIGESLDRMPNALDWVRHELEGNPATDIVNDMACIVAETQSIVQEALTKGGARNAAERTVLLLLMDYPVLEDYLPLNFSKYCFAEEERSRAFDVLLSADRTCPHRGVTEEIAAAFAEASRLLLWLRGADVLAGEPQ